MSKAKTIEAPKKRRSGPSGPTQNEDDRAARGGVQMKLRVGKKIPKQLDDLVAAAGSRANRSSVVEGLIVEKHTKLKLGK